MNSSRNSLICAPKRSLNPIATFVLAIVATASSADDMLWLEREWISDADATMAANPQLDEADDTIRTKWKSIYGHMRWRFANGMLEVTRPDAEALSSPYTVRQLDGERIEILIDDPSIVTTFEISRTGRGFCSEVQFYPSDPKSPGFPYVECFKPYGA